MTAGVNKLSMAVAILTSVSKYGYKEMVPFINKRDAFNLDTFKSTKLAECFTINTSQAFVNGHANANHIYELFGDFAGHDATQVRLLPLDMHNVSFERWLNRVADDRMYCDDLGILSLSSMYRCHSMVVTVNKMWSTIEHSSPLNLLELLNECSVKLIYLGQLRFGELKPKLRLPQPMLSLLKQPRVIPSTSTTATTEGGLPKQSNVQLPSSKEEVIDASTSGTSVSKSIAITLPVIEQTPSLPVATGPPHVGMACNGLNVETNTDSSVNVETQNGHVHVETRSNDQHSPHVETTTADRPVMLHVHVEMQNIVNLNTESVEPADTQGPVQKSTKEKQQSMLLQKTAKLILKLLKDVEIDMWCNKTSDYH